MSNFWNERYGQKDYVYGEDPNKFFAEELNKLKPGTIILPCEGEGRNAAYAASQGWLVHAFDSSEAGKTKAMLLAQKKGVDIFYDVEDALTITFPENSADAVAFIFAHFPADVRKQIHQKAVKWLRPGAKIILEAFNPMQLGKDSGGPKDSGMLYTEEMLKGDFQGLKFETLQIRETTLNEGNYHAGLAEVIRFVGMKI